MAQNTLKSFSQVFYVFPFRNMANVLMAVQFFPHPAKQDFAHLLYVWYHTNYQITNVVSKKWQADGVL
jgi:hypothetical protein